MTFANGERIINVPVSGGKTIAIAYVPPAAGDTVILLPDASGRTIAHKYTAPAVGDKCLILPTASGGTVALSVNALSGVPARTLHGTFCIPGTNDIYIFGGTDNTDPYNDIWRSKNGGVTFSRLSTAVNDDAEVGIVIPAGVALANGHLLISSAGSDYLHVSEDGGFTWDHFVPTDGFTDAAVRSAMVELSDGTVLHMQPQTSGSANGVTLESDDEGENWTLVNDACPWSCSRNDGQSGISAVVTSDDDIIVAKDRTTQSKRGLNEIYRSANGGSDWSTFTTPFDDEDLVDLSEISLAVDSSDNVYAMFEGEYTNQESSYYWDVWKSEDAGANWTILSHFVDPVYSLFDNCVRDAFSLVCDNSDRLHYLDWYATQRRLRSIDGGEYWSQLYPPEPAWPSDELAGGIED